MLRSVKSKVAWRDPCHLGRELGITGEPRKIIAGPPGVEYVEADALACCGGVFNLLHYDPALKIGMSLAEEIAATGGCSLGRAAR